MNKYKTKKVLGWFILCILIQTCITGLLWFSRDLYEAWVISWIVCASWFVVVISFKYSIDLINGNI